MAQDIYYYSKREEREHNEKILDHRILKTSRANFKSTSPHLMSKHTLDLQFASALLNVTHFSFLGWFQTWSAALCGGYSTALASPTQSRLHLQSDT